MPLSVSDLTEQMIAAAKGSLSGDWSRVSKFAQPELAKLAQSLADIVRLRESGEISELEANSLLQIHRNTTRAVMLTVQGMALIAVENAINAALGAVKDVVNGAAGFTLL